MNVEFTKQELEALVDGLWAAKDVTCFMEDFVRYDALLAKLCAALAEAEQARAKRKGPSWILYSARGAEWTGGVVHVHERSEHAKRVQHP